MNFYYDITLDFLENNYLFYDITPNDQFWHIKKIPLLQVTKETLQDFIANKVQVEPTFLQLIENKTITSKNKIKYAAILTDKNNALAFLFDDNGIVSHYSPLSITDEINLLEVAYTIKEVIINYHIINKNFLITSLRQEEILRNVIKNEIDKLYKQKNKPKLKFLYLEWFDTLEENIEIIYQQMCLKIQQNLGPKEEKIAHIIKISYNNV